VGGAVGRVFHIGKQPMNIFAQSWYNPVESDRGASPNYTFKLNVTFLFPELIAILGTTAVSYDFGDCDCGGIKTWQLNRNGAQRCCTRLTCPP
jgi:hypothetical protein